jgi:hypothetical protein
MELNLHARLLELVRQAEASQWLVEHWPPPPPCRPPCARWCAAGATPGTAMRAGFPIGAGGGDRGIRIVHGVDLHLLARRRGDGDDLRGGVQLLRHGRPRPAQTSWLVWTALSLPVAAAYLFAILPQFNTLPRWWWCWRPRCWALACFWACHRCMRG